jgi:thiamine biosynthesis lipoprotein
MGMPVSVHLRGDDLASARVAQGVAAVFSELRHVEGVFSPYRSGSELTRWQRGELPLAAADPMLAEVLTLCDEARERTGGWFDPRALPDPRGGGSPRYHPTGLVKGWAVRRASRHLAALGGSGWCLNAGGDVVVATAAGDPPWRVGVEDPSDPARLLRAVVIANGAVATSGTTHRGAHIIDPFTGRPATGVRAVTVAGPDLLWADVYATAAVARGPEALDWLDDLADYQALLVEETGAIRTTTGWPV